MTEYGDPNLETIAPLPPEPLPAPAVEPASPRRRGPTRGLVAALIVVSLVVGFGTATIVLDARDSGPEQAVTILPDDSVLGGLILRQSDAPAGYEVLLLPQGTDLTVATLDLCNGTFPSEKHRVARRQVAMVDVARNVQVSTEAILYRTASGGTQAFRELRSVAAHCPSKPVTSPVGEGTATTKLRAPPDATWPHTPTVDRLAFDFVSTDATTGNASHSMAIYLRRGRALIGLYFPLPDSPQAVVGHSTIAAVVALFESRLAQVPAEAIGG